VIWRGFGVCLVERMRLSLKALNGQALGLTSRHPRTAGSACRQLQESFVVGPLMAAPLVAPTSRPAPPIYKLEALPADGMSAAAAEWSGLRHAPVGSSAANLRCLSVERKRPITPKPLRNPVS